MKYLDVPHTTEDMRYSVGMTGVTVLKQSRYKYRHAGYSDIEQKPTTGFQIKTKNKTTVRHRFSRGKAKQKPQGKRIPNSGIEKRKSVYVVNKKEIIHRVRGYINQQKGEKLLYFWTVTFPVLTSDNTAYILLNKWLTRLRQESLLKEYLWIAERQQNKTIHFHLVINNRMCIKKANRFMRACIMYSIDKKEIPWSRDKAKNYNGVDIAKDRKTRRVINFAKEHKQKALSNYLTKYITKNDEKFDHLAWHSSRGYSNLVIAVRFTNKEVMHSKLRYLIQKEEPLETEYYIHYRWKGSPPKDLLLYLSNINQAIQQIITEQS